MKLVELFMEQLVNYTECQAMLNKCEKEKYEMKSIIADFKAQIKKMTEEMGDLVYAPASYPVKKKKT